MLSFLILVANSCLVEYHLLICQQLPSQYMYAICKFKCANHRMPIVTGRYTGVEVDNRTCDLCNLNPKEIGDEFHYLFKCPFFREDRVKYIKRFFYTNPNMYKMTQLFNYVGHKEMLNLGKFIYIILSHFRNRQYRIKLCHPHIQQIYQTNSISKY